MTGNGHLGNTEVTCVRARVQECRTKHKSIYKVTSFIPPQNINYTKKSSNFTVENHSRTSEAKISQHNQ